MKKKKKMYRFYFLAMYLKIPNNIVDYYIIILIYSIIT